MRSRDRILMVSGLVTLAVSVFAVGGASRYVVILIAVLVSLMAASQLRSRRGFDRISPLMVLLVIPVVLTALQLLPFPDGVIRRLSPTTLDLVLDGEALLNPANMTVTRQPDGTNVAARPPAEGGWHALSGDPATGRTELAKLCAYLLVAWMALRIAASDRGRRFLLYAVAGSAGVVAVTGLGHELLDAKSLFGIYTPSHANPVVMAPLLNSNHLACFMVLGAVTAGGLALNERRAPPIRALWIVIALACVVVSLATHSRGGVLGLAAGATIAAIVIVLQRLKARRRRDRRDVLRVVIPGVIILLCSLVLVVFMGGVREDIAATKLDELSDPHSKFGAWRSALVLVQEAPILGNGRGAFESAFTRVHEVSGQVTFSHVENEYLQIVLDWGLVGALCFAIATGLCLLVLKRRWRDGVLAATAIGGLFGVAVHSLVDFGMELPGLAIPVILIAATLLHVPLVEISRTPKRLGLRTFGILLTLVVAALAALPSARTLAEDHDGFRDTTPTLEDARASFERHPLDYLSAAYLSRTAERGRDRSAFLNHALRLHPTHPGLHRAAARWLAESGRPKQAALEFRLALLGTGKPEMLLGEILKFFPKPEEAAAAIPEQHPAWQQIVRELIDLKRGDIALPYMLAIVGVTPNPSRELWRRILTIAKSQVNYTVAERAARALLKNDGTNAAANELARIQVLLKKYDEARRTLSTFVATSNNTSEQIDSRMLLCDIQMELREWTPARDCLSLLLQTPIPSMTTRRKIHERLSTVELALGNPVRAAFERRLSESNQLKSEPVKSDSVPTTQKIIPGPK